MPVSYHINLLNGQVPNAAKRARHYWLVALWVFVNGCFAVALCLWGSQRGLAIAANQKMLEAMKSAAQQESRSLGAKAGDYPQLLREQIAKLEEEKKELSTIDGLIKKRVLLAPLVYSVSSSLTPDFYPYQIMFSQKTKEMLTIKVLVPIVNLEEGKTTFDREKQVEKWSEDKWLKQGVKKITAETEEFQIIGEKEYKVYSFSAERVKK